MEEQTKLSLAYSMDNKKLISLYEEDLTMLSHYLQGEIYDAYKKLLLREKEVVKSIVLRSSEKI